MNARKPGPQHELAQHRIRVQPQLGSSEQAEAQVQHLQRQAVARRVFVLPHEAAALEDAEQPMHGRRRLPQRAAPVPSRSARAATPASASQISSAFSSDVCLPGRFGGWRRGQWLRCV